MIVLLAPIQNGLTYKGHHKILDFPVYLIQTKPPALSVGGLELNNTVGQMENCPRPGLYGSTYFERD